MTTIEESNRRAKERREAEQRNPLLKLHLGDLVQKIHKLYALDSNIIKPQDQIPQSSLDNYKQYVAIIEELN